MPTRGRPSCGREYCCRADAEAVTVVDISSYLLRLSNVSAFLTSALRLALPEQARYLADELDNTVN